MKKSIFSLILFILPLNDVLSLPPGFVYLEDIDPTIIQDIRYYHHDNFVGRPITGYQAPRCILTLPTALALAHVQKELKSHALGLKVFDCYRPQTAVNDFIQWSQNIYDQKMKASYYPHIRKSDVFRLNYVAARSGHTRGSTVDLTLVYSDQGSEKEVPMGTHFDFLDQTSYPLSQNIAQKAQHNRLFLRELMLNAGFKPLHTEWWHFTLRNEPYPYTYFNFSVK